MPGFAPKASKNTSSVAILSWDAFPPPPPEAETWQPDPGSVPKPGALRDPRFNRDPEADRRSKAYRKEARMYGLPDPIPISRTNSGASPSPSANGAAPAPSQSLGQWPDPPPRATGYPQDLVRTAAPQTPPMSSVTSTPPGVLPSSPSGEPTPITLKKSTIPITPPVTKGTMETLAMPEPNYRRPQTPIASTPSTLSSSPDKSVPAWAAPLEKALAEDIRKASAESTKTDRTANGLVRPEATRNNSVPPYLSQSSQSQGPRLDPAAQIYQWIPKNQDTPRAIAAERLVSDEVKLEDEAVAWKIATTDLGVEDVKQGLSLQTQGWSLQTRMLSAFTAKRLDVFAPTSVRPKIIHEHKVKVMLIRAMEAELDLGKVATERELMAMDEREIDKYHEKARSAHEHWWKAE